MRKSGVKERIIKYMSVKNGRMMIVHSDDARNYARALEEDEKVKSYEVDAIIDVEALQHINTVDIRGSYFDIEWLTDFLITYVDGTVAVREIVKKNRLSARPVIEKLELSRRYWGMLNISNWKIVLVGD